MANVLPTEAGLTLMVADDVRPELNSKFSLSGLYFGNRLNVKDIGPNIAIPLALIIVVSEGEGEFKMKIDLLFPSGKSFFQGHEEPVKKEPNKDSVTVAKIMNFPIAETGKYSVNIFLDGRKFARELEVGHDPTIPVI